MLFETKEKWADSNPLYKVFDDPENPSYRWRAVELPLSFYYYHLTLAVKEPGAVVAINLLLGEITDVVDALMSHQKSTLYLHVPDSFNNGEPGIYKVNQIIKQNDQPYVLLCNNGKYYVIDFEKKTVALDTKTIKKDTIWKSQKSRKTA